jgi:hypothetical protein
MFAERAYFAVNIFKLTWLYVDSFSELNESKKE